MIGEHESEARFADAGVADEDHFGVDVAAGGVVAFLAKNVWVIKPHVNGPAAFTESDEPILLRVECRRGSVHENLGHESPRIRSPDTVLACRYGAEECAIETELKVVYRRRMALEDDLYCLGLHDIIARSSAATAINFESGE